jgi:hypothetical protein
VSEIERDEARPSFLGFVAPGVPVDSPIWVNLDRFASYANAPLLAGAPRPRRKKP